jgi:predicted TIM-barrel fold metal-dependent hydrolase
MRYTLVSTDDHLQEPPDLWTRRMSQDRWGERIPHIRRNADGTDCWFIDGRPYVKYGRPVLASVHGVMQDRKAPTRWDEIPEIAYVPSERVKAMDRDGVDVHAFFGNVSGIAGNTFSDPAYPDEEFREACIRAYNDYQIDEFAEPFPGRFITLAQLPMWSAERAVAEAKRMAERGVKGITFAFPHQFGYPHISDRHWDPLWAFAREANLSVNFHIGSGASMGIALESLSRSAPSFANAEGSTKAVSANVQVMTVLLFSGIMQRFPELKIVSSESGVGWVPYLLEAADHHWDHANCAKDGMPHPPSEYFRRQCYVNFWFESAGIKMMRDHVSLDNVMFGSDYPHPTGTWPSTRECVARSVEGLTPEERRKVMVENAVRVFNL